MRWSTALMLVAFVGLGNLYLVVRTSPATQAPVPVSVVPATGSTTTTGRTTSTPSTESTATTSTQPGVGRTTSTTHVSHRDELRHVDHDGRRVDDRQHVDDHRRSLTRLDRADHVGPPRRQDSWYSITSML